MIYDVESSIRANETRKWSQVWMCIIPWTCTKYYKNCSLHTMHGNSRNQKRIFRILQNTDKWMLFFPKKGPQKNSSRTENKNQNQHEFEAKFVSSFLDSEK